MRTSYLCVFCILLYSGFAITACGTHPAVEASTVTTTEGQALMDLQAARNSGAIDQDEYEDQKEEILDRYDD